MKYIADSIKSKYEEWSAVRDGIYTIRVDNDKN